MIDRDFFIDLIRYRDIFWNKTTLNNHVDRQKSIFLMQELEKSMVFTNIKTKTIISNFKINEWEKQ